ncbi:MAG: ring-1,2-phenylacetyl-CoA epoxidase subunit PaaD [Verrucomicrobiales bacterium]|jgi:ring-1,2-phenylacetyl-CoA epoxidase subunit PaaD
MTVLRLDISVPPDGGIRTKGTPSARGERSSRSDRESEVGISTGSVERDRTLELKAEVLSAVSGVDDPEYPGVSIVDLGLLESVEVDADGTVSIGLIPTFSGCPALAMIAADVEAAVRAVEGVADVSVNWLRSPAWSPERLSDRGREALAREFTVAVQIGNRTPECPLCGGPTVEQSMFGPSRCRSVHRCEACRETVEVMRG